MSGGLRTSVKGYLNAKRLALSGEIDTVHEMNETINRNFTALQAAADSVDKKKPQENSIASISYGLSICDGSTPCLPLLTSPPKSIDSYGTTIRAESPPPQDVPSTPRTEGEILLKRFLFNELKTATWNFHPHNKLGEGGFGSVFKGWVDDNSSTAAKLGSGTLIAVKRINQDGFQGHEEWLTEMYYLGRLRHPNLVMLLGYCLEDNHLLLVYEFMARGSLDYHLFGRASYLQPLSWILRMKIALGAAKVLAFLQSSEKKVIHRDFKSSNILLDSDYNAKLSDFGFATDGPGFTTRVIGTSGYAAPEYVATGHLTGKLDVYGFGVVMLELLSGRWELDINRPRWEHSLVDWAKPYLDSKSQVLKNFDARMEGQYSVVVALKAAKLANQYLSSDPKFRPYMNEVVKALEQLQECSDIQVSGISQNESHQTPRANSSTAKSSRRRKSWISSQLVR